ncbi:hypothetical protein IWW50_004647 [Coemansia erecta]|nr:hypothetical protein IWW50_004647 [Coemansia erecta]
MSSNDDKLPEHLRLAGYWADTTMSTAQHQHLQAIHTRLSTIAQTTQALISQQRQAPPVLPLLSAEHHTQTTKMHTQAAQQLDQLSAFLDKLDSNIGELEATMSKAESATGLTLSSRLLKQFRNPQMGVPYLRQWPDGVPRVIDPRDHI